MKYSTVNRIGAAVLAAILAGCASSQEKKPATATPPPATTPAAAPAPAPAPAPTLSAEDAVLVTVTATVQSIDVAKREVTLKGPLGNVVTFAVDQRVKRLAEIKVGDEVTADYYVSLAGELRAPTAEEKEHPIMIVAGAARAPQGTDPAGGVLRAFKVVTTVQGLDLPTQTVTLSGPLGNFATIRARNVNNLKQLRLGDTIVVTYTEALAISVEKVTAHKKN